MRLFVRTRAVTAFVYLS